MPNEPRFNELIISRVLHAGYVVEFGGNRIIFDPIFENPFSRNCFAFPSVQFDHELIRRERFAAVFLSHFHEDHVSLESLELLDRSTPVYLYCRHEKLFRLIKQLGFKRVLELECDVTIKIGSIEVTPRRAENSDVDTLFQITCGDLKILNAVDAAIDDGTLFELMQQAPWDLILWPFQPMREAGVISPLRYPAEAMRVPEEWIEQLARLRPVNIVPSSCQFRHESWSWYNKALFPVSYRQFKEEFHAALKEVAVVRMDPSRSYRLSKTGFSEVEPLKWVKLLEEADSVDYSFCPMDNPPPASEVARQFKPLGNVETERVLNYCRSELLKEFRELEPSADVYFQQPRVWRLRLLDSNGNEINFHYLIRDNSISICTDCTETAELDWLTEISITKLFSALEMGESLTSLYIRVNDIRFAPRVESAIDDVDIFEDPLIRCLTARSLMAHQEYQLRKILSRKS